MRHRRLRGKQNDWNMGLENNYIMLDVEWWLIDETIYKD